MHQKSCENEIFGVMVVRSVFKRWCWLPDSSGLEPRLLVVTPLGELTLPPRVVVSVCGPVASVKIACQKSDKN